MLSLWGCDADYSKSRIPDRPVIDEAFYKVSIAAIDRSIENTPSNHEAYYKKARILDQINNLKAARITIEKAIELDKNNPEYLIFLAKNLYKNNEFRLGLSTGLAARKLGLNSPDLHFLLAGCYLKQDQPEKAMEFNKLALQSENLGIYYDQLGEIYVMKKDTLAATGAFKHAITLAPRLSAAYDRLTKLYIGRKNIDSAAHFLKLHRKFAPDNLKLWYDQGLLYRMMNKDDSAKLIFSAIIAKDNSAARSMVKMSELFFDKYNYDSANYYAERALAVRSTLTSAMLMQAKVLVRKRYYNQAREKFDQLFAIDSTYQEAIEARKQMDRSINYYRRLQQEREENMQVGTIAPKKIKPE